MAETTPQTPKMTKIAAQLARLQQMQMEGTVPMLQGNRDASFTFQENESKFVHVYLLQLVHNPLLKKYDKWERTNAYYPEDFNKMIKEGHFAAYDEVRILHDPRTPEEVKAAAAKAGANFMGDQED